VDQIVLFAALGLGAGAVHAILGLGLVVSHRASGVVNFAQGAMTLVGALAYTTIRSHLPTIPALLVTTVVSALMGVIVYLVVLRHLEKAPALARLVALLGLLAVLQGASSLIWGTGSRRVAAILPNDGITMFDVTFPRDRLWLALTAILLAAGLSLWYRHTWLGILTRASADSHEGLVLCGHSPTVIGAVNWGIAAALATIGGVLVSPVTTVSAPVFILGIVPALAAALIGRFSSLMVTAVAGLSIGVVQSLSTRYIDTVGFKDAIPFLVIIVMLVASGSTVPSRAELVAQRLPAVPATTTRSFLLAGGAFVAIVLGTTLLGNPNIQFAALVSAVFAMLCLSLVLITGMIGQVSLAQMTFAGLGAFFTAKTADWWNLPFPLTIVAAALIVLPLGVVLGAPAVRVRGQNLAVVTFGIAVAVEALVFNNGEYTGGLTGLALPDPALFGVDLSPIRSPERLVVVALLTTLLVAFGVVLLRRSPIGVRWLAVRNSERAAAASGVNVMATKLQAFAVSAVVAAGAGGLFGYALGSISFSRFGPLQSVLLLSVAYLGGIGAVSGALLAGLLVQGGLATVFTEDTLGWSGAWVQLFTGAILVLNVITRPDGLAVRPRPAIAPASVK
jgi:branched-chain amino acid transport system permease protein